MKFTRYLYIQDEVQYSLLISLLKSAANTREKSIDEILFWAYELYFSGWEKEVFQFVFKIYADFYESSHTTLARTFQKKYNEWSIDKNPCHLGTMLRNLAGKPYSSQAFLKKYIPDNRGCCPSLEPTKRQPYIIVMMEEELEKYKTLEAPKGKAWAVLREACRFSTYRTSDKCSVFVFRRADALFRFREKWMYYAAAGETPWWTSRIRRFGGVVNHTKKTVDFPSDEAEEEFRELYDYEPDEQSKEIQEFCVGLATRHGELALLQIAGVVDFSGNDIQQGGDHEEVEVDTILPPPPPTIDYFV